MTPELRALLALGIMAIVFGSVLVMVWRAPRSSRRFIYRTVTSRYPATDGEGGEIVELECGHVFRLTHIHRKSLICEACQEEKRP